MKILFVTFGELSLDIRNTRSVSILRALADAGHQVDVITRKTELLPHPYIQYLGDSTERSFSVSELKSRVRQAVKKTSYDVLHAVDAAVLTGARCCRFKRIKLVYDAHGCLAGKFGQSPSLLWHLFPSLAFHSYKSILQQASRILSTCQNLTDDLMQIEQRAAIVQLEDVPLQSLLPDSKDNPAKVLSSFKNRPVYVMVCSVLPGNNSSTNTILKMARKVLDAIPRTAFIFRGLSEDDAMNAAANLDIQDWCRFLRQDQTDEFMALLKIATAACFFPEPSGRYAHAEVYTLLCSPAPLVAVDDGLYGHLLRSENCVRVLHNTETIAESLIRVTQEPLFSLGLVTASQQLVADKFSFSSFKHKIRMVYGEMQKT